METKTYKINMAHTAFKSAVAVVQPGESITFSIGNSNKGSGKAEGVCKGCLAGEMFECTKIQGGLGEQTATMRLSLAYTTTHVKDIEPLVKMGVNNSNCMDSVAK